MLVRFSREDKNCEFDNYIGLYGSPERKFIVEEMERMLISLDYSVTENFFRMLLQLDFFLNNPQQEKHESESYEARDRKEQKIKNSIKLVYLEKFAKVLPSKNEKAFQKSLETFFSYHAEGEKPPPTELTSTLTNSFSKLSKRTQSTILQNSWDKLKNPSMLPVLQNIYNTLGKTNSVNSRQTESEPFEDYFNTELLNSSIKGIYELDKNIGKQIILDEIRRPKQRVYTSVLELLPKTNSPEVENLLLDKLKSGNIPTDDLRSVFSLISTYETPKLISKLRDTYADKADKIECGAQIEFLKIFLRSDIKFGEEILGKVVKTNDGKGCIGANLADVIEPYWSPEIEQIVLNILEDDNMFIFGRASEQLRKNGSIETRDKIWKRLERFNKEEQSKKDSQEKKGSFSNWQRSSAEWELVVALSESPNWMFEQESNKRLSQLCLYAGCKEQVEKLTNIFGTLAKIETVFDEENKISFSVYQYKNMSLNVLKKKLAQYPSGTKFTWIHNTGNLNDEKDFQEIKGFVGNLGMSLVK
jgi:hypothetical protein